MAQDKLRAVWSKRERDVMYHYPRRCDGNMLHSLFGHTPVPGFTEASFLKELDRRGYDLTTLRFSIALKTQPPATKGAADE